MAKMCNSSECLWSEKESFCSMLQKASVPLDGKWPTLILYLRSLKNDTFLSEVQKSKMQEVLFSTLQDRNFSEERLAAIQSEIHTVVTAPYEQKLREVAREATALAEEVNKVLGDRRQDVITVAENMETDLARGAEPVDILSGLRGALRDVVAKMEEDTTNLTNLSHRDCLTGLANRRSFDAFLDGAALKWEQERIPAALVIFDIDHFKKFNDTYGHLVGDQVLRALAGRVQKIVNALEPSGANVLAARFGGEEFTLTLRGPIAAQAVGVGEKIRCSIEESSLLLRDVNGEVLKTGLRVTVSVGVAAFWQGWSGAYRANLVDCADKALYHAKRSGRNCTVEYTPEGKQTYTLVKKR